ncbi:MAG: DUF1343 domain-containing protein [Sphingobacteriia bacterium]|nr:DUF1343 domain-containing protein [Sphingobacteriia bacterium]
MFVYFGIDQLLKVNPTWKQDKIGLITNEAATSNQGAASRKLLQEAGFNLVKLFSPEHGLSATGADGEAIHDGIDELTDLPIISLYGKKLAPGEEDLYELDLVIFDVPDIGVRFYTYLSTLTYAMQACAAAKKRIIVLDRPNPISGNMELVEGPWLEEACSSFIGRWPMPVRHSCTLGELARYFNVSQQIGAELEIIPCTNWNRNSFQPDWETPFISTSPAIRSFQSMLLYPGLCLLEATNLNEGRGTDFAFQLLGAPWLNNKVLAAQLNNLMAEDLHTEAVTYLPTTHQFAGEQCKGLRFTVKDPNGFKPVFFGMLLLKMIRDSHPREFSWHTYKTNVNPNGLKHLDKLLGIPNSEALYELPFPEFLRKITQLTTIPSWKEDMDPYLLY